jgi:Putative Flp pilus-assembly TadE/G-like
MKRRSRALDRTESGYIMVITSLILGALVTFAGFSIDVGAWYARGEQLQRGADAAALAGVVWMPDLVQADQAARAAAARNGFIDGTNNVAVSVLQVNGNLHQLQVVITDKAASQFFSKLVLKSESITRSATAEYVLAVPLGSPKNVLGTGNVLSGLNRENFWAAASGFCSGRENGDLLLPHDDRTSQGGSFSCPGLATNPDYNPAGYLYGIEMAQAPQQPLTIELYDPAYNTSGSAADSSLMGGATTVTTTYSLYGADNTPFDNTDNPLLFTRTVSSGDTSYRNAWMSLYTIPAPQAGEYFLRVSTKANEANSFGSNGFGIRARVGTLFTTCTTIPSDPGYSSSCPQVHGVDNMSIFANQTGSQASFYLAQIDPVHAGKTMEVKLFDPGEGASTMELLDPNGNPASFTWTTPCNPPTAPTGGCSGSGTILDVSAAGTQPYANLSSTSKYNDRTITLHVSLPSDYSTRYGGKVWWKIRYTTGSSSVTDRTTWAVAIVGDPVHLVK